MLRVGSILLLLLLAAGCAAGGSGSPPESSKVGPSVKQRELSVEQIAANAPGLGPKRPKVVVASSASALSKSLGPKARVPDAGEGTYIAAFWGEKPTGGFSMSAKSARGEGKRVAVELALKRPPKNAFVAQALTYPYVIAVVRGAPPGTQFEFTDGSGHRLDWPVRRTSA